MRAWVLAAAVGMTGCMEPKPPVPVPITLSPSLQAALRAPAPASRSYPDAKSAQEQQEMMVKAEASAKTKQAIYDQAEARIQPLIGSCIRQNVNRLAQVSTEQANIVAVAVVAACRSYERMLAQAFYQRYGFGDGGFEEQLSALLVPRITGLVVEARAKPAAPKPGGI